MKKVIALLVVLFIIWLIIERHRLFVRDPFATLTRNGEQEAGAQIYINASNDVYIQNDRDPMYIELVRHGQVPGIPKLSSCIHWVACLLDRDPPTLIYANPNSLIESMDSKTVAFRDSNHRESVVSLY